MKFPNEYPLRTGRIMEIVLYLVGEMQHRTELAEIDTKTLEALGYSAREISTAFSWLFDKVARSVTEEALYPPAKPFSAAGRMSFRPFHEVEHSLLSREARGFLLQLREIGLIGDSELEMIIDRLWYVGAQNVGLETIRDISADIIFHYNDSLVPGSRFMLGLHDSIQ
jgi:Smg protein